MNNIRRYEVMAAPSGWCLYDTLTGEKVKSFGCRKIGRFEALKALYETMGWNWLSSKYVRENPHLATI